MCLWVHCGAVDTELECLAKAWIWSCYPSTTRKPSSRKRGLCSGPIFCQSHNLPSLVILNSDPHSTIVLSDAALSCKSQASSVASFMLSKVRAGKTNTVVSAIKEREIKVLFLLIFILYDLQKIDMALNNYDLILHSKKTHSLFENGRRSSSLVLCKTSGKWHEMFFPPIRTGYGWYAVPFNRSAVFILI